MLICGAKSAATRRDAALRALTPAAVHSRMKLTHSIADTAKEGPACLRKPMKTCWASACRAGACASSLRYICCVLLFLMASPLLFVWTGSTEQFSGSPADFALSVLLFFPALLAAFLLPTRMFAVQRDALCVLNAMGAVRRRVAMGSIRALYIVGAAESFPYAGQKRLGRWEKGAKGQKRKFAYLPSVLVYDTAQEGVYRGKDRTHYDGFVYAFVVTGKKFGGALGASAQHCLPRLARWRPPRRQCLSAGTVSGQGHCRAPAPAFAGQGRVCPVKIDRLRFAVQNAHVRNRPGQ